MTSMEPTKLVFQNFLTYKNQKVKLFENALLHRFHFFYLIENISFSIRNPHYRNGQVYYFEKRFDFTGSASTSKKQKRVRPQI